MTDEAQQVGLNAGQVHTTNRGTNAPLCVSLEIWDDALGLGAPQTAGDERACSSQPAEKRIPTVVVRERKRVMLVDDAMIIGEPTAPAIDVGRVDVLDLFDQTAPRIVMDPSDSEAPKAPTSSMAAAPLAAPRIEVDLSGLTSPSIVQPGWRGVVGAFVVCFVISAIGSMLFASYTRAPAAVPQPLPAPAPAPRVVVAEPPLPAVVTTPVQPRRAAPRKAVKKRVERKWNPLESNVIFPASDI